MNYVKQQKNRQLLSRLIFLSIFSLAVFGIFLIGQYSSTTEQSASMTNTLDGFIPTEKGQAILVEYSDFQCPACGMYYPLVKQLKAEFGDKLKVVYKHFPLQQIHKNANLAARASEAALNQNKFWEMHNILFEKQKEWSESGQALSLFTAYAMELGLEKERFLDDIDRSSLYDKVNSDYQEGIRLKVSGTPTFFLNGEKITNPRGYDEFKKLIEQTIRQ
jgi:protein-disulfide isomerase